MKVEKETRQEHTYIMIDLIQEAIETFNLSKLEEYYLDANNKLRARGFIYDEYTGIYLNEFGLLDFEEPVLDKGQEPVRAIFDFSIEPSVVVDSLEFNTVLLQEAVA